MVLFMLKLLMVQNQQVSNVREFYGQYMTQHNVKNRYHVM